MTWVLPRTPFKTGGGCNALGYTYIVREASLTTGATRERAIGRLLWRNKGGEGEPANGAATRISSIGEGSWPSAGGTAPASSVVPPVAAESFRGVRGRRRDQKQKESYYNRRVH
jgi:hypothetical protein